MIWRLIKVESIKGVFGKQNGFLFMGIVFPGMLFPGITFSYMKF